LGRRLLAWSALLSLLLCVATAALWVRSYFAPDEASWTRHRVSADGYKRSDHDLISYRGWLVLRITSQDFRPLPPGVAEKMADEYRRHGRGFDLHRPNLSPPFIMPVGGWWGRRGFSYREFGGAMTPTIYNEQSQLTAPHGALAAVAALLPAAYAAHRWRSRRPARPGLCAKCGYDLRATPGRCPECGTESNGNP
jgi:predicted Zn-ribbon and HTH transcriptional regulator